MSDGFMKIYRETATTKKIRPQTRKVAFCRRSVRDRICVWSRFPNNISPSPPRYTDASLVKRMEELGIGRPSTYASIMQVINVVMCRANGSFPSIRTDCHRLFLVLQPIWNMTLRRRWITMDEVSDGWLARLLDNSGSIAAAIDQAMELSVPDHEDAGCELEKLFFTLMNS